MGSDRKDETEPLLDGMGEPPGEAFAHSSPAQEVRDAVWRATAGHVRSRARRRRTMVACGVLLAYAAGLGSFWLVAQRDPEAPLDVASVGPPSAEGRGEDAAPTEIARKADVPPAFPGRQREQGATEKPRATVEEPGSARQVAQTPARLPRDPEALSVLIAQAPREEQPGLLIRAGDRYLNERGDIKRATQCYRRALNLMSDAELTETEGRDTWLLASLKQATLPNEAASSEKTDSLESESTQETSNENTRT